MNSIPHRFENGKEEKLCNHCHIWKPLSDFQRCNARKDGYNSMCVECYRPYSLANFKKNYVKRVRQSHLDLTTNTRTCTKCGETKDLENFCRLKKGPGGYHSRCRECLKEDRRIYYNKVGVVSGRTKAVPHRILDGVEYKYCGNCKQWIVLDGFNRSETIRDGYMSQCKKCASKRAIQWTNATTCRILNRNISSAISASLKGKKKGRHWEDLVPFTFDEYVKHLDTSVQEGMTQENYGKTCGQSRWWEVDHRLPKVLFKFSDTEDEEFKLCWSLSNLFPMWKDENRRKQDKVTIDGVEKKVRYLTEGERTKLINNLKLAIRQQTL